MSFLHERLRPLSSHQLKDIGSAVAEIGKRGGKSHIIHKSSKQRVGPVFDKCDNASNGVNLGRADVVFMIRSVRADEIG